MSSCAIMGAQWGDEGKGKITDFLSQKVDCVIRYQGGSNAGHTLWNKGVKTVLHVIPSGVMHENCVSVIDHGVVFDPCGFLDELGGLKSAGINISPEKIKVSSECCVVTNFHKLLDCVREGEGKGKIGTTKKGIGPTYEDKVARKALKLKDLFDKEVLRKKIGDIFLEKKLHVRFMILK